MIFSMRKKRKEEYPEEAEYTEMDDSEEPAGRRKRFHGAVVFLLVLALIGAAALIILFGFRTKNIHYENTGMYTEEELTELLLKKEYTYNSLYFCWYYNYRYEKEIPFVEAVHARPSGLSGVNVSIEEKKTIGYVTYADSYLYFDETGKIVENSIKLLKGLPELTGYDFQVAEEGEMLPIDNKKQRENILTVLSETDRRGIEISEINCDESGTITIFCGNIEVRLGLGTHLEEKIELTGVLLGELAGKKGVLHMEDYDGTNGTRSFKEAGAAKPARPAGEDKEKTGEGEDASSGDDTSGENEAETPGSESGYDNSSEEYDSEYDESGDYDSSYDESDNYGGYSDEYEDYSEDYEDEYDSYDEGGYDDY